MFAYDATMAFQIQFCLTINPNRSLYRLSNILGCFPAFPVHLSFACRHSFQSYSRDVARYAFKDKADNMLNDQTKSAQALTADFS